MATDEQSWAANAEWNAFMMSADISNATIHLALVATTLLVPSTGSGNLERLLGARLKPLTQPVGIVFIWLGIIFKMARHDDANGKTKTLLRRTRWKLLQAALASGPPPWKQAH